jgi:NADPH:quinone reductase-like Zn-dependent oxidoreductase
VVTTSSPSSDSLVSTLGADEMIDYHSVDLPKHLAEKYAGANFDLIFDTIGVESVWEGCEGFLKDDGIFLDCGHGELH